MKGNIAIADELYKASAISEAPKEITEIFCARNDRASFQIFLDAEHEACRVNTGSAPALGMARFPPRLSGAGDGPFRGTLICRKISAGRPRGSLCRNSRRRAQRGFRRKRPPRGLGGYTRPRGREGGPLQRNDRTPTFASERQTNASPRIGS